MNDEARARLQEPAELDHLLDALERYLDGVHQGSIGWPSELAGLTGWQPPEQRRADE